MQNQAILDAAWVTLKVGLVSSTVATMLGTMAGVAPVTGSDPGNSIEHGWQDVI